MKMRNVTNIASLVLVAVCCNGGSCDQNTSAPPRQPDPWPEKVRQFQSQLKENEDKLHSDMHRVIEWRTALLDTSKGDLDADILAREIDALIQKVSDNSDRLRTWHIELSEEANRRGIKEK
jgi:hypothetical protein